MSTGNGVDLAAIYQAIIELDRKMERNFAAVRMENARTRADLAALRSEVTMYHATTVGHGMLLSELEERVSRLERGEPPKAA